MITSAPSGLRCPHCRQELAAVRVRDVDLNECGRCGGIWIDNAGAQHVVASPEAIFGELAVRLAQAAPNPGAKVEKPVCAACSAPLENVKTNAIEIDVCRAHGTWFDAYELAQLVSALERKRAVPSKQEAEHPGVDSFLVGAGVLLDWLYISGV